MTKSTGVGRGGARPGSGPKPKPQAVLMDEPIPTTGTASEMAGEHGGLAVEVLKTIAAQGASETARVAAARTLLEFGFGKPVPAQVPAKAEPEADAATQRADDWATLLDAPRAH